MASCGTLTVVEESSTDDGSGSGSDVSQLNLQSVSRSSEVPNEITVNYTVQNQITSGDGESLTATVDIELDGTKVDEDYLGQIAPGQTPSGTIVLDGVDAGDHEVCVSVR